MRGCLAFRLKSDFRGLREQSSQSSKGAGGKKRIQGKQNPSNTFEKEKKNGERDRGDALRSDVFRCCLLSEAAQEDIVNPTRDIDY